MYEYFISNVIFDKSIVISCYIFRNIWLSSLISNMMRKNLFIVLPMKLCYTFETGPLKITDLNCNLEKYKNLWHIQG
jgi:hypothetical protein